MFKRKSYDEKFKEILDLLGEPGVLDSNIQNLTMYSNYSDEELMTLKNIMLGQAIKRQEGKVLIKIMRDYESVISRLTGLSKKYKGLLDNIERVKKPYDLLFESKKILTINIDLSEYRLLKKEEDKYLDEYVEHMVNVRRIKNSIKSNMYFIQYYLERIYSNIEIKAIMKLYKLKKCNLYMFIHQE